MTTLLGDLTQGANTFFGTPDVLASKWTAAASGPVGRITVSNRASSFTSLRFAVYSHTSGTDRPDALLGESANTITDATAGDKTVDISDCGASVVASTVYWVAIVVLGGTWNTYQSAIGDHHTNGFSPGPGSFPATWTGANQFDDNAAGVVLLVDDTLPAGAAVSRPDFTRFPKPKLRTIATASL